MNKLLVSIIASIALLAAAPAMAQQNQQSPTASDDASSYPSPDAAATQKTNYTDAELEKFITAQEGIAEVREEYIDKIESADSQQEAQALQMKANDGMTSVIEDVDMDIPTYNAIATAYNSEQELRKRIDALM